MHCNNGGIVLHLSRREQQVRAAHLPAMQLEQLKRGVQATSQCPGS